MLKVVVLLLWLAAGPVLSSVRRYFCYESKPKTWEDARQFCKSEHQGDLATVVRSSDTQALELKQYQAWFGLKQMGTAWQWMETTNVHNIMDAFAGGEPENGEECGKIISGHSKAYGEVCDQKLFVFCESLSYVFLPETKTWAEGLEYCRSQSWRYMDFPDKDDFFFHGTPIYYPRDFPVWIGLHGDGGAWKWSNGSDSHYRNWDAGSDPEPSPGPASCVAISSLTHSMSVKNCSEAYPFLCYRHNLVLVPELLTWEEALETCRTLSSSDPSSSYSLLSVEDSELVFALSQTREATTSKVWAGLRFLDGYWFWSDSFNGTLPSLSPCPESTLHCGAMDRNSSSIQPNDCSQRLNALCYKEP